MSPSDDGLDAGALDEPLDDASIDPPPGGRSAPTIGLTGGALVPRERGLVRSDPFRRYLAEIARYPTLDREQELILARRYRDTGDREALFRLVTANLRLVVRVAHSYRRAARNLLDLVQEGNLGLLHAVERFDPDVGVRLPTYATWWVRAYMIKFLLDNVRLVRVGTTNARRKLLRNLRREKARLEEEGFEVGPKLLAEHFGVSVEDVEDVQRALESHDVSLDEPVGVDREQTRGELFADPGQPDVEETVARRELQQRAEATLARFRAELNDRDRALLDERILSEDPRTLQAIGDRFGITREAVRQSEERLVKRLRQYLREELADLGTIEIGPK